MSDSEDTEPIFPIVNRPAPVLERIRGEQKSEPAEEFGEKLGRELATLSRLEGEEQGRIEESIVSGMVRGVADDTALDEDEVNIEKVREIANSLFTDESELLEPPEELTLDDVDQLEENDSPSFSPEEE
jgi:hypothetical protein